MTVVTNPPASVTRLEQVTVYLESETLDAARDMARREDRSVAYVLRRAIRNAVAEREVRGGAAA